MTFQATTKLVIIFTHDILHFVRLPSAPRQIDDVSICPRQALSSHWPCVLKLYKVRIDDIYGWVNWPSSRWSRFKWNTHGTNKVSCIHRDTHTWNRYIKRSRPWPPNSWFGLNEKPFSIPGPLPPFFRDLASPVSKSLSVLDGAPMLSAIIPSKKLFPTNFSIATPVSLSLDSTYKFMMKW